MPAPEVCNRSSVLAGSSGGSWIDCQSPIGETLVFMYIGISMAKRYRAAGIHVKLMYIGISMTKRYCQLACSSSIAKDNHFEFSSLIISINNIINKDDY